MPKFIKFLSLNVLLAFGLMFSACGGDDVETVSNNATLGAEEAAAISLDNATASVTENLSANATSSEVREVLGIGFVYVSPIEQMGWTYEHNQARLALDKLEGVVSTYVENESTGPDAERVMQSMASKGYDLIIATSVGYGDSVLKVAAEYPEVKFLHCAGTTTAPNVSTYFGRMYEARYLTGMVAGAMTKNKSIGYVAAFPLPEVIRGINAFTLGVREVNPDAEVRVVWTREWYNPVEEANAVEFLVNTAAVDVVAQHTDSKAPQETAEKLGIYSIGYHSDMSAVAPTAHLVAAVWHWEPFYIDVVEKLKQGEWNEVDYWGGLGDGIVNISPFAAAVPQDVQDRVAARKNEIAEGQYIVFQGPLYDYNGELRIPEGEIIADQDLRLMDWFVNGVLVMADAETQQPEEVTPLE
jgi:Uncharacterized ABC-type transport system, periplasmic component/surface lipoprotein